MKEPIKLIVFDMAGTTVNEENLVYKTIQSSLEQNGFHFSLETVLTHGAGKEKRTAIRDILSTEYAIDEDLVGTCFNHFTIQLKSAYEHTDIAPFTGVTESLKALKQMGISIALNTGYDRTTATNLIQKMGWKEGREYDTLITASDVVNGRPFPDMIERAMKHLNIPNPCNVVKIGDSAIDILEGKSAHCRLSIGITTGAQDREELMKAQPDNVVDSLNELVDLIRIFNNAAAPVI